jgi:hypothetical protein
MSAYTFELIRRGEAPNLTEIVEVSDGSALWCQVEAFALRMSKSRGAFIRVLDEKGQPLIRAGVATALASIAKCACAGCALKSAAKGPEARLANVAELSPCHKRGSCSCGNAAPMEPALAIPAAGAPNPPLVA